MQIFSSEAYKATDFASAGSTDDVLATVGGDCCLTEAQASLDGLRALNANVQITHVTKPTQIWTLGEHLDLGKFTIVVCSGVDMLDAVYVNHQCRLVAQGNNGNTSPFFVYTDLDTTHGLGFFDLNANHDYIEPRKEAVVGRSKAAAEGQMRPRLSRHSLCCSFSFLGHFIGSLRPSNR
jgi:hypothetical protein